MVENPLNLRLSDLLCKFTIILSLPYVAFN